MTPFIGTIMFFGFTFAPRGWAICDGRLLSISQYTAVFSLLGTMYGGNGTTTFALPDLRGRFPMGQGQGGGLSDRTQGEYGGTEAVTLDQSQMPAHSHQLNVAATSSSKIPAGNYLGVTTAGASYETSSSGAQMGPLAIGQTGASNPHPNLPPYLVGNWCIALDGVYPSRD